MSNTPVGMGKPLGFGSGVAGPVIVPPNQREDNARARAARALILPLPEQFMIPSGVGFNPEGETATAAVQANVVIAGATVTVPANMLGVIASVTLYITNMLTTTNVQYTVLRDNNPIAGYQNLKIFPRVSPFVANTFDIPIRITGPSTITVTFNNNDGGTYVVGAALSGWQWGATADQQWKAAGL